MDVLSTFYYNSRILNGTTELTPFSIKKNHHTQKNKVVLRISSFLKSVKIRQQCSSFVKCSLADGDCELLASGVLETVHGLDVHDHRDGDGEPHQHQERYHQTRPANDTNVLNRCLFAASSVGSSLENVLSLLVTVCKRLKTMVA